MPVRFDRWSVIIVAAQGRLDVVATPIGNLGDLAPRVRESLAAAEELAKEGISVEVVDPRTLVPLDRDAIRNSVRKTGRLVVADEAGPVCGASAEVAAVVTEDRATFRALKAPVSRVCALEAPIPYTPILETAVFPNRDRIAAAVRDIVREK